MMNHLNQVPPPMSNLSDQIPPGWDDIVARLLEKKPEDRYQNVDEILAAIDAAG
jgi:hypothetical protein